MDERRKHTRHPQRLYLKIEDLRNRNIAFTSDVSLDGIFIETSTALRPGTPVNLQLTLPNGEAIKLSGHVRWATRNASDNSRYSNHGVGILLNKVPADFHNFISSVLNTKAAGTMPEVVLEPVVALPAESAPEAIEEMDETSQQLISNAYKKAKTKDHYKDHYEVLGLSRDATTAQIKQAYYQLSKDYHPDRHLKSDHEEMKEQLAYLFHRITDAYAVLSSEEQRRKYDLDLVEHKLGRTRRATSGLGRSNDRVKQGRAALKRGDVETAAVCFELAVQKQPDKGKYRTLLAYALSKLPKREKEAEAQYQKAIEIEPSRLDNYIGLGRLYKKSGMMQKALRTFEDALAWDADNDRVQKEIKTIKEKSGVMSASE